MDPAFEEEARKRLGRGWERSWKEVRKRFASGFGGELAKPSGPVVPIGNARMAASRLRRVARNGDAAV
jgi:hypothetical protein